MGHNRPDCRIPSSQPLKGKVLQAELTETEDYVQRVKQSWSKSGCSIILATWTDQQGRDLISFQVSCPQGPIYLKLSNISSFVLYLEALPLMLDKCCCGGWSWECCSDHILLNIDSWLWAVGKQFISECRTVCWRVSALHTINLMLEKIRLMGSVKPVLEKATTLTKFIWKLVNEKDFSWFEFRMPCSGITQWLQLSWLLRTLWPERMNWRMVIKASGPLISVLSLIQVSDKPFTGYIYETMDKWRKWLRRISTTSPSACLSGK